MIWLGVSIPTLILLILVSLCRRDQHYPAVVVTTGPATPRQCDPLVPVLLILLILAMVGALGTAHGSKVELEATIALARSAVDGHPQPSDPPGTRMTIELHPPERTAMDEIPILTEGTEDVVLIWYPANIPTSRAPVHVICLRDGIEYNERAVRWPEVQLLVLRREEIGEQYNQRGLHHIEVRSQGEVLGKAEYLVTAGV